MPKGYWITSYQSISNPGALAEYAALASTAIAAHGGRFVTRGKPVRVLEGVSERCVVVEFDSVAHAIAAYESPAYRTALAVLRGAAVRTVQIVEGG